MADTEKELAANGEAADRGSSPLSAAEDGQSPTSAVPVEMDATAARSEATATATATETPAHEQSLDPQGLPSPETQQTESPSSPQYVEFDESAGPQVVVNTEATTGAAAAAAAATAAGNDAEAGAAAVVNAGAMEAAEKNAASGPPGRLTRLWRMARKSPYIVAAIISFTVGILALIILPVVLHTLSVRSDARDHSPTASASACPTCSASSTSASSSPSQSTIPDACTDPSAWATDVSYMGVADEGATTWPYKLLAASDAAACCTTCYNNFAQGCQGWAYLPWQDTPVPCTIIYGWNGTTGESTTCPNGRATINFSEDTSRTNSTGSKGPCGTMAS